MEQKTRSTGAVVESHLHCFGKGDLEGILSDYAPDAVLFTQDGILRGREAIRPLFVAMLAEFGQPGTAFTLQRLFVDGEHACISWTAETAENLYELGTDTFWVHDGRIAVQSFASKTTRKG